MNVKYNVDAPSAKPKLSTTGRRAETLKKDEPSFISSATMRPRRLATTPYTLPRTSATDDETGYTTLKNDTYYKLGFRTNT